MAKRAARKASPAQLASRPGFRPGKSAPIQIGSRHYHVELDFEQSVWGDVLLNLTFGKLQREFQQLQRQATELEEADISDEERDEASGPLQEELETILRDLESTFMKITDMVDRIATVTLNGNRIGALECPKSVVQHIMASISAHQKDDSATKNSDGA